MSKSSWIAVSLLALLLSAWAEQAEGKLVTGQEMNCTQKLEEKGFMRGDVLMCVKGVLNAYHIIVEKRYDFSCDGFYQKTRHHGIIMTCVQNVARVLRLHPDM